MTYPLLLTTHLLAAFVFIGTVFFEVIMLEGIRQHVPREAMSAVERAIGARARRIMPWVLLLLYSAGIGMAWYHRAALTHPTSSAFSLLLTLKIVLATSVFVHFLTAMTMLRKRTMTGRRSKIIHISIFCHVIAIVLLAKLMFYA
ncbi:hypothetical protein H0A58_09280 [Alcaligenaceae bacterium]|nr:hypothetical protein [Alcaligenaceae bacterium]